MKVVNVSLSDDMHRRLKLRAIEDGVSMSRLIAGLIEGYLTGTADLKDVTVMAVSITSPPIKVSGEMTNAISTKTTKPSTAKRPLPDFSKSAQAKGRMHGG